MCEPDLEGGSPVEHVLPYPYWVDTDDDRLRFDLAVAIACALLDAPAGSAEVWAASRAIFRSSWPICL